jgi:hypothetical protein
MNEYNFTIKLHPWGENPERGTVGIDPAALCGYWEHKDGSEGGGLWFERTESGDLELVDYDGHYTLPRLVIAALCAAERVTVPEDFE